MRFQLPSLITGALSMAAMVSAAPIPDSSVSGNDFITVALNEHNIHRANHSTTDVTYSDTLGNYAATVAASCKFAHDTTEGGGGYGQNIAATTGFSSSTEALADAITNSWYNGEEGYFNDQYGKSDPDMTNFEKWGHFTQVIWGGTTEVGCSVQLCPAGTIFSMDSWFSVCNYGNEGNMGGEYAANINRPNGAATDTTR